MIFLFSVMCPEDSVAPGNRAPWTYPGAPEARRTWPDFGPSFRGDCLYDVKRWSILAARPGFDRTPKNEPRRSGVSGGCTYFREGSWPTLHAIGGSIKQKHKFCIKFNIRRPVGCCNIFNTGINKLMDQNPRPRPQPPDKSRQVPARQRRSRRSANGPAGPGAGTPRCHGRLRAGEFMIDLDDKIVEVVIPPQPVAWFIGRPVEWAIVAAVGDILAPRDCRLDAPYRQQGPRRAARSARHHRRTRRNRPRGVAPSPSRLFARMPERPSATGIASPPAMRRPRVRSPGRPRTRMIEIVRRRTLSPQIGSPV